jgi:hypothetical protein
MLFLKYTVLMAGLAMFLVSAVVAANDLRPLCAHDSCVASADNCSEQPDRRRTTLALVCLAWAPVLMGMSVLVKG